MSTAYASSFSKEQWHRRAPGQGLRATAVHGNCSVWQLNGSHPRLENRLIAHQLPASLPGVYEQVCR